MTREQMDQRQEQLSERKDGADEPRWPEYLNHRCLQTPPPAPQPSRYLLIHGPVLGAVAALCLVDDVGLAEALPHEGAVILRLVLARTGVGDVGAIHELSIFCPVVEAVPATALPLGREGTG